MKTTIEYGNERFQYGELYIPETDCIGTVCLFHGGFWSMPYGLNQLNGVSTELLRLGYCVWNTEYRRTGDLNYKWTHPFDDAINAVNELINIKKDYPVLNLDNVFVVGHSAGGHLAIWLNSQELKIGVKKFIGLAPLLDLEIAFEEDAGDGAVERLLQGKPNEFPERYAFGSPIKQNRKNSPELIIHGELDDFVPIE